MKWKDIKGFEGRYRISDCGDIISLQKDCMRLSRRGKNHLFRWKERRVGGYIRKSRTGKPVGRFVTLRKDKTSFYCRIHRLVLETFVGECPENMEACHNDGNPLNNNISNLRWDTHKENIRDCINHGRKINPPIHFGESHPNSKLTEKAVRKIRMMKYYHGLYAKIARQYGIALASASRIYNGIGWEHIR